MSQQAGGQHSSYTGLRVIVNIGCPIGLYLFIEKPVEETPDFSRGRNRRRGIYESKCELEK
jgi:hypothetical protein